MTRFHLLILFAHFKIHEIQLSVFIIIDTINIAVNIVYNFDCHAKAVLHPLMTFVKNVSTSFRAM